MSIKPLLINEVNNSQLQWQMQRQNTNKTKRVKFKWKNHNLGSLLMTRLLNRILIRKEKHL